jgi:GPH family glycoside/pentoside/hexuronide:cation symporter
MLSIVAWGAAFGLFAATAWSPGALHAVAVCMGIGSSGVFAIPEAIFPDVIEWDEHRTGRRWEASYAGVARFTWQLATAAGFALVGELLAAIGYRGEDSTGPEVLLGLRMIYLVVPALLLGAALLVFRRFPLDAAAHAAIVADLRLRKQARTESP